MPNRIIKESAFTSDKVASLSDFEFRLWVGLITQADDAGRGDARPAIIKGRVFALRERTTIKEIESALNGLAASGCIILYSVGGKPYYVFPNWTAHQRVRNVMPKYPSIDDADILPQSAADCGELPQSAALIQSNPIQSESNPNPKRGHFMPPSKEEAEEYHKEQHFTFPLSAWLSYYEQNGWLVGKSKMKDWRASMRYWQSKEKPEKKKFDGASWGNETPEERQKMLDQVRRTAKLLGTKVES